MWHETYPMSSTVRAEPATHPPLPTSRFPTAPFFYRPGTTLRLHPYDIDAEALLPGANIVEVQVRSHLAIGFGEFWQQVVCDITGIPLIGYTQCEALLFDPLYIDIFDIPFQPRTHPSDERLTAMLVQRSPASVQTGSASDVPSTSSSPSNSPKAASSPSSLSSSIMTLVNEPESAEANNEKKPSTSGNPSRIKDLSSDSEPIRWGMFGPMQVTSSPQPMIRKHVLTIYL